MVYVSATFLMNLLGLYNVHFIFNFTKAAAGPTSTTPRTSTSPCSRSSCCSPGLINVFRSHLVAVLYNISVWWNVLGVP